MHGRLYGPLRSREYTELVNRWAESAVWEEPPKTVTEDEEFREYLEEFLTNRQRGSAREDILSGRPWQNEETGRHLFRLKDLVAFLDRERSRFRMELDRGSARVSES